MGWLVNLTLQAWAGNLGGSVAPLFNPWANPYVAFCVAAGALATTVFRAVAGRAAFYRAATDSQRTAAF